MCDCMEQTLNKLLEKHPEWNGKKVKTYTFPGTILSVSDGLKTVHGLPIDVEIENQKKRYSTFINMAFCPFCGEKFNKEMES